MKNAVGREIPDSLLVNDKEVYQGKNYMDGKYLQKAAPRTKRYETPRESKIVDSIVQALQDCGAKSGMTFSFHHHLRDGDYVMNLVMAEAVAVMGWSSFSVPRSTASSTSRAVIILVRLAG